MSKRAPAVKVDLEADLVAVFAPGQVEALARMLARAMEGSIRDDTPLVLKDAAEFMGEPEETFRRRDEYRKARVSRPGERNLRFDLPTLRRIKADRLAANWEEK